MDDPSAIQEYRWFKDRVRIENNGRYLYNKSKNTLAIVVRGSVNGIITNEYL